MLPAQPNKSLVDGLAVLQALAGAGAPVGSREMARQLGLEPTRVNRLLKTLSHLGMGRQDELRRYVPGPAMHVLSAQSLFGSGLLRRAMGPLRQLGRTKLTVALGVLWRGQVCYLYHASPDTDPSDALGRVGLFPAERSGIGLALMAAEDARTWPPRLAPTLRQVRRRGYALVRPAGRGAIRSLGVVIDSPPSAAVAVSGDFADSRLPNLLDAVRETAAAIAGQTERNER